MNQNKHDICLLNTELLSGQLSTRRSMRAEEEETKQLKTKYDNV
jgi:hypothetical protein